MPVQNNDVSEGQISMFEIRLAPMCGITDHIFRTLCYEQGCDLAYTEMISAMGYLCAPEQRATKELMIRGRAEPKLILQLFGRDPDTVAEAAKRICSLGIYDGIDLNMGCPARKIAPSGEGCGLMRTPDTAYSMMKKTVAASDVPVSVKMRLGYDREHINVKELAHMAEDAGIVSVTVHGRTREQYYSGKADWNSVAEIAAALSIPVAGNGDVGSAGDARAMIAQTGCTIVLIGRGALGNPWIFAEWKDPTAGKKYRTAEEISAEMLKHFGLLREIKGERTAVMEMRKHFGWYTKGVRGAAELRRQVNTAADAEEIMKYINAAADLTVSAHQ